ncbi:ubiquitin-conjugating enzyme [Colletotrichum sublineola]|nr:ubiquitin-conjugating enzyme [Colletotrichum sublineola]
MSYKHTLTGYPMAKGKLSEDTHDLSPTPSGSSPSQPATERNLTERKKMSVPNLPPPAMGYFSASLNESPQSSSKNTTETPIPFSWTPDKQSDGDIEMKDALAYDPSHSLSPLAKAWCWLSNPSSNAPEHSQLDSPGQTLAKHLLHWQDPHGSTAQGKGIDLPMPSPGYMEKPHAAATKPFWGIVGKSMAPTQNDSIPRQHDLIQAIPLYVHTLSFDLLPSTYDVSLLESPSKEEKHLRAFVQQMIQRQCPGCKSTRPPFEIGAIFEHTKKILVSKKPHSVFKCQRRKCRRYFCPGCMKESRSATSLVQPATGSPGPSTWCCSSARLFFIFLLLCGPHSHPRDSLASLLQDFQVNIKPKTPRASVGSSAGASVEGSAAGTGYGRCEDDDDDDDSTVSGLSRVTDKKNLVLLPELFAKLQQVWPSTTNSSEFDQGPPELLLSMIRRSPLMIKVAELLRNDCVEDVMHHSAVYRAMFDFIQVVVAHPFSAPVVRDSRTAYPFLQTLLPVCFTHQTRPASSKGKDKERALYEPPQETLQSLASLLSPLTEQSRAVMHYMDPGTEDTAEILAMCKRICDLSDKISRPSNVNSTEDTEMSGSACPPTPSRASTTTSSVAARLEETHKRKMDEVRTWLSVNKVAEIETDNWLDEYSFSKELAQTAGSAVKPGRAKRIVYDLATLRTSLPEGIFVRHDSSRLDAMKVLIVGPEGTPYENGLFEFDLFCPLNYPDSPPVMLFKTIGSGRRFNPNLYVDGKICLSLLGTWHGESWCPKTSTLLQLLVSIQSMIFCAEPLWNEPDVDSVLSARASDLYNWEMRADTLVFAMSDWLRARKKNSISGGGAVVANNLWDDVVGKHFELRWRRILETAVLWEKENDMEVDFNKSGLRFIMSKQCAAERFSVGIRRLRGYFAEWARTEEDMALVQVSPEQESQAVPKNVTVVGHETVDDCPEQESQAVPGNVFWPYQEFQNYSHTSASTSDPGPPE